MRGYKDINGFLWPEEDQDCAGAVWKSLPDLHLALAECRGSEIAVQAGGNVGVWPKRLGEVFEAVYTFEPEPKNFYCLAHNCPDAHVMKFQAALGYTRNFVGMAYAEGTRNMGACYVNGGGKIPILRIDDLGLPGCDLIQLDLEGYELEALLGAEETIRRYRPVIMIEEKHQFWPGRYPWGSGDAEEYLATFGYKVKARPGRDLILVKEE